MNRGWTRSLLFASLLPLVASAGCDALTVHSFAGTVMQFTFEGINAQTIPPNQHLELWARTQYDDIVRVPGYYDLTNGKSSPGIMIRQAISLTDPCMIDGYYFPNNNGGNLLSKPAAFATTISSGGVTQTPEQQAQEVIDRIDQLTTNVTIASGGPLLAVLPFDPAAPPSLPDTATSDERRGACDAFTLNDPLAYAPNPFQLTAPLRGFIYGFVKFLSVTPPSDYDGFRIDTPINLKGVQEIFFTLEGNNVDPLNRGPLFLISKPVTNGIGVVHFDLVHADPKGTASGTAALEVDLDNDPVQF
ncbi:MAG TPA: hypothetical protein VF334_05095 [Polyangia bacterium]